MIKMSHFQKVYKLASLSIFMATKDLFILGGLALTAFFLFKKTPGQTDLPLPNIPGSPPAIVIPPAPKPAPKITPPRSGVVKTATTKQLKAIDIRAKADPTKVVYYPDQGIVTAGGLGYSTAYPEKYLSKAAAFLPKVTNIPMDSYNPTSDYRAGY
jgi:hypothetical protein